MVKPIWLGDSCCRGHPCLSSNIQTLSQVIGLLVRRLLIVMVTALMLVDVVTVDGRWRRHPVAKCPPAALPNSCKCTAKAVRCENAQLKSTAVFSSVAERFHRIQEISIRGNTFQGLDSPLFETGKNTPLKHLRKLIISNNYLVRISANVFTLAPFLVTLDISYNELILNRQSQGFLRPLSKLKHLKIKRGFSRPLRHDPGSTSRQLVLLEKEFQGANLTELHEIDLSWNFIRYIPIGFGCGLPHLKELNLEANHLRALNSENMSCLFDLSKLRLRENSFQLISPSTQLTLAVFNTKVVHISRNDFTCTCRATNFIRWFQWNQTSVSDSDKAQCGPSSPPNLRKKFLTDLDMSNLVCSSGQSVRFILQHSSLFNFPSSYFFQLNDWWWINSEQESNTTTTTSRKTTSWPPLLYWLLCFLFIYHYQLSMSVGQFSYSPPLLPPPSSNKNDQYHQKQHLQKWTSITSPIFQSYGYLIAIFIAIIVIIIFSFSVCSSTTSFFPSSTFLTSSVSMLSFHQYIKTSSTDLLYNYPLIPVSSLAALVVLLILFLHKIIRWQVYRSYHLVSKTFRCSSGCEWKEVEQNKNRLMVLQKKFDRLPSFNSKSFEIGENGEKVGELLLCCCANSDEHLNQKQYLDQGGLHHVEEPSLSLFQQPLLPSQQPQQRQNRSDDLTPSKTTNNNHPPRQNDDNPSINHSPKRSKIFCQRHHFRSFYFPLQFIIYYFVRKES